MIGEIEAIPEKFLTDDNGSIALFLHVSPSNAITAQRIASELKTGLQAAKRLKIGFSWRREKRSLNANAYLWSLLQKMAEVLHIDKDSIYLEMLDRYGVFTHVIVKPEASDRLKSEWKSVRELGVVTVNGKKGIQFQCFYGSSTYDTKEMSALLDGVVREAKELNIDVFPPDEITRLSERWRIEK